MKVYNPTPETIHGKCHGIMFPIQPGHAASLSKETSDWILERWSFVGLVSLDNISSDKEKMTTEIVTKSLEGLEKYIEHLNEVMEGYLNLDSEIKQQNHFGTCLRGKGVKRTQELTEIAIRMSKDLEAKYGISVRKVEAEEKSRNLTNSIDTLLSEFEADSERQQKARLEQTQMDSVLSEITSQVHVSGNTSVNI